MVWDMVFEKRWAEVPAQPLISNGTAGGQLQVADAFLWRVKQIIYIKSNTQPVKKLQVKRVTDKNTILVGRPEDDIDSREDISAYLVVDVAVVYNVDPYQPRPKIGQEDFFRAVYEEEPTMALRTTMVDRGGRYIGSDPDFPFYVQLSDGSVNIGTVNAELEVQLSHKDNDPDAGDVHDSVRIGDGVDEMKVNEDGSIPVVIVQVETKSTYNEISSLAASIPTTLVSYTAPIGKVSYLHKVFVSGTNIATYKVKLNGTVIETVRTYFGGDLNTAADFSNASNGRKLNVSDVVLVEVEHLRPFNGDFNGRIQVIEV